ncbi:AraC family transcriptional regulator [Streptomyces sp. URMC 123]|uniref:helix-turn-helix transcriptional regulator n=1 Tax=Streptomyces sp. URMC 123 TaxID=3423403 RepID=UPI003F1C00CA
MKKNGQIAEEALLRDVADIPYRPSAGAPPGIEVLSLADLTARAHGRRADLHRPGRPAFHQLVALRAGTVRCSIDFTTHALAPGDWLWVRPGQVVQFLTPLDRTDGRLIVFPAGFLSGTTDALTGAAGHSRCRRVTPPAGEAAPLDRLLDALVDEYGRLSDLPLAAHIEALRHLLSALLLRFAQVEGSLSPDGAHSEPFRRFREAVEQDFARTHRVEDYAARLGYSARTLTRATRAAAGCGAKRFIDDRVLLEAKRLLVHTALPPAAIGERTGFTHPTAFSAFFRQHTGTTPTAFRELVAGAAARGAGPPAPRRS